MRQAQATTLGALLDHLARELDVPRERLAEAASLALRSGATPEELHARFTRLLQESDRG